MDSFIESSPELSAAEFRNHYRSCVSIGC